MAVFGTRMSPTKTGSDRIVEKQKFERRMGWPASLAVYMTRYLAVFRTGMSPTKTGSYGFVGNAEFQETHWFGCVFSHQAVLESTANQFQNIAEYSPSVGGDRPTLP